MLYLLFRLKSTWGRIGFFAEVPNSNRILTLALDHDQLASAECDFMAIWGQYAAGGPESGPVRIYAGRQHHCH